MSRLVDPDSSPTPRKKKRVIGGVLIVLAILPLAVVTWLRPGPIPQAVVPPDLETLNARLQVLIKEHAQNVEAAPWDANAHAHLGLVYQANKLWKQAIELAPLYWVSYYHRGGSDPAAKKADAASILSLADAYYRVRNLKEARRVRNLKEARWLCDRAAELDPNLKQDPKYLKIKGEEK